MLRSHLTLSVVDMVVKWQPVVLRVEEVRGLFVAVRMFMLVGSYEESYDGGDDTIADKQPQACVKTHLKFKKWRTICF